MNMLDKDMLDKDIPVPLYYQLKELLRSEIQSRGLAPGDMIPPERELAERFGVSRMTTRQAITDLVMEGLLVRQQGKGTYVAHPRVEKGVAYLTSFSQDMLERGMTPGSKVVSFSMEQPPPDVRRAMPGVSSDVFHLHRIRYADNSPMAIEHVYLPPERFPGLDKHDLERQSLYSVMRTVYGIQFSYANQSIQVKKLEPEEAKIFGFKSGAGLLTVRTIYDTSGHLIEHARSIYHPDRYEYHSVLYPKE